MASADGLRRAVKGLSEAAFRERFGTEAACREALFAMRWREGLTCPACGHRGFCQLRTRKVFQCNRCKKQLSLTAGTVFQDTKLPLTTWFAAVYHLTQGKNGISSIELARRLGVRQPTAWLVKHKLMRSMAKREAAKPKLAGRVEMDDAYLGGERQAGPGRGRQDADRRRGRDHGREAAQAPAAHGGRGVPQAGGREARQGRDRARRHRGQRRAVLLAGGRGGRVPALPDRDRLGQAGRELDPVPLGEHDAGQRQGGDHRHLPPRQPEARPIVPDQLRLPLQPALPARQHRRAPRLGRGSRRAPALQGRRHGCMRRILR